MYLCKCNNVEATLVVCQDDSLPDPLYLKRTGQPTDSFVGNGSASKREREQAVRSGPSDDVVCPHCRTVCTWSVCLSCGNGGEALAGVQPTGKVKCRECHTEQRIDDLHFTLEDDQYYVPG